MPTFLSEITREAAQDVEDERAERLFPFLNSTSGLDMDEGFQAGFMVLQTHLTTSKPDVFQVADNIFAIDTKRYLSDREREDFLQGLIDMYEEAERDAESDQMARMAQRVVEDVIQIREDSDAVLLTYGAILNPTEAGATGYDVETVLASAAFGYIEPKERLVGPEHQNMSPEDFASEFENRGGLHRPLGVPDDFVNRSAAGLAYAADQSRDDQDQSTNYSE